jgi:molybdate transport system substrate-binding protein
MHKVVGQLADGFRQATGHIPDVVFGTVGALQAKLDAGETADAVILAAAGIDKLARAGKVLGEGIPVARTAIGLCVRDGAPTPDIASPATFRQTLVEARRIAFSDAAVGGSAGVHLAALFKELGVSEAIRRKGMPQQSGAEVASRVAEGSADIGMTLMAEIVPIAGARIVGPLPAPLGNDAVYVGAVMAGSGVPEVAHHFLAALTAPATRPLWQRAGFDRATEPA